MKLTRDQEELLEAVVASSGGLVDMARMKVVWALLNHQMEKRLIETHQPVEFDLFTVSPCPYRNNWESHMLSKFPGLSSILRGPGGAAQRIKRAEEVGAFEEMVNSVMLAVRRGLVYWTLRVKPKTAWWRRMLRAEQIRLKASTSTGYFRLISNEVYRLRPSWLEFLYSSLGEMGLPCGAARPGPQRRGRVLVDYYPPSKMGDRYYEIRPRGGVVRRGRSLHFHGTEGHREAPAASLREVPHVG